MNDQERKAVILAAITMTGPLQNEAPEWLGTISKPAAPESAPESVAAATEVGFGDGEVLGEIVLTAGPEGRSLGEWTLEVQQNAVRIATMLDENSDVSRALEQIAVCKKFTAVVDKVTLEKTSTRAKVRLLVEPSKFAPEGVEYARTERTDTRIGMAMAKNLRKLKGHNVLLWVEVEKYDGGSVRVIRHVEDLGEAVEQAAA